MVANYQHEDRSSILQTFLPLIMSMEHGKLRSPHEKSNHRLTQSYRDSVVSFVIKMLI